MNHKAWNRLAIGLIVLAGVLAIVSLLRMPYDAECGRNAIPFGWYLCYGSTPETWWWNGAVVLVLTGSLAARARATKLRRTSSDPEVGGK